MSLATDIAFQIRLAEARDAEAMTSLENSAGALFREIPALAWLADGEDLPAERYRDLIAGGASWVIAGADDRPVAFLSASREADALHIWEIGVRRDLQRRGLGRRLCMHAIETARQWGFVAITLTTFRDVPWNAPFYTRLGFETLEGSAMDARLAALLETEAERGLSIHLRCAMRLGLSPH